VERRRRRRRGEEEVPTDRGCPRRRCRVSCVPVASSAFPRPSLPPHRRVHATGIPFASLPLLLLLVVVVILVVVVEVVVVLLLVVVEVVVVLVVGVVLVVVEL
jgi:Flp pilus assembly protein TadB